MKKLMIVAAAAAMVASAEAGIATTNCHTVASQNCPQVVFRVTGSGKALDVASKDYTTVGKLRVNGWLILFPADADGNASTVDDCCYPTYSLYVSARIGKNTTNLIFAGAENEAVDAWTVFGKKLDDARAATKSKKYKLESQLGISADFVSSKGGNNGGGVLVYAEDLGATGATQPGVAFFADAFGKATWKAFSKTNCTSCGKETVPDGYDVVPGNYSGWFAGVFDTTPDEECLTCNCTDLGVFGGTWKAKYQTRVSTWEAAARNLFGNGVSSKMGSENDNAELQAE